MAETNCNMSEDSNRCHLEKVLNMYYLPAMYGIIFFVGFVGNVTSIVIYVVKMRPWKSNSIIMLNLALTDLLYVFTLPFLAEYYSSRDTWTLGDFMCRFVRFGFHLNLYGSILNLTCLCVFRYIVVVHPLKLQIHRKFWGIIACLIVWTISIVEIVPMLTVFTLTISENNTKCLDFASNDPVDKIWWYTWAQTVLGYLVPLVLNCVLYFRIARTLAKGPHTHSLHRVRARKITMLILVVFVLCFMPFHVLRLARVATRMWPSSSGVTSCIKAAYTISRPIAGLNTFFNLALYTLAGDKFQQAFLSMFSMRCCISKVKTHMLVAVVCRAEASSSRTIAAPANQGHISEAPAEHTDHQSMSS